MDENMDINGKLDKLIQAVTAVVQKVDEQQARLDELDSVLYDGLIGPANEQIAQNEYDSALSDFRAKYAEKLGPFEGAAKAIEGDDFDVYKAAFDGYNDGEFDFSPDEYVDKITASLTEQIAAIREAVAEKEDVSPEDVHVEVEGTNENGEPKVEVEVESEEDHKEEEKTEATEGETKEEVDEKAEAEVDHSDDGDEDELKAFEDELKADAEKEKKSMIRG